MNNKTFQLHSPTLRFVALEELTYICYFISSPQQPCEVGTILIR